MSSLTILISLQREAVLLFLAMDTEPVPTPGAPGVIFCWFLSLASAGSCESLFQLVIQTNRKQNRFNSSQLSSLGTAMQAIWEGVFNNWKCLSLI